LANILSLSCERAFGRVGSNKKNYLKKTKKKKTFTICLKLKGSIIKTSPNAQIFYQASRFFHRTQNVWA
jgi:hypothetical protein